MSALAADLLVYTLNSLVASASGSDVEEKTPIQIASQVIGLMSILAWLFAQLPQLYANYKNKDTTALSVGFLFLWLLGDISNLVGCILTDQLVTQTITAIYFCLVDACLWSQFFYYRWYNSRRNTTAPQPVPSMTDQLGDNDDLISSSNSSYQENTTSAAGSPGAVPFYSAALMTSGLLGVGAVASIASLSAGAGLIPGGASAPTSEVLASAGLAGVSEFLTAAAETASGSTDPTYIIGLVIAWLCTSLYLGSRVPQIFHNFKRQSVEGLSLQLFICAALGNLFYSVSIFLYSVDPDYLLERLPYLLGSAGVLVFDFIITIQFWYYNHYRSRSNYTSLNQPAAA
ncbi:hypothetical protein H696_05906 [Fonticula alba]|uniref:Uncharacterized protein n=1 Tax=Fonticula alba TaxID=691883 RepID=A0A058Z030_FONAL|nr:hypothetical protein H696_05906 [Fonticula alba]KCV67619.1 hypothetical protein H696_05906 [Fonticula alba]|eukprot:XP_009497957.1 hypothetical protein H696_05906 [Fonticula alba]